MVNIYYYNEQCVLKKGILVSSLIQTMDSSQRIILNPKFKDTLEKGDHILAVVYKNPTSNNGLISEEYTSDNEQIAEHDGIFIADITKDITKEGASLNMATHYIQDKASCFYNAKCNTQFIVLNEDVLGDCKVFQFSE